MRRSTIQRQMKIGAQTLFMLPVLLMPLIFTGFNTNTIIIKETIFQICTVYVGIGTLILWVFYRTHDLTARPTPLYTMLLALLIYLAFSTFFIAQHPKSIHELVRWTTYFSLVIALIEFSREKRHFNLFLTVTLFTSFFATLYAILQSMNIDFFNWETFEWEEPSSRRVCSAFGNPDFLASYLVALLPLTLTVSFVKKGWIRGVCLILAFMQILSLVFSYSRGGWIATALTLITLFSLLAYINWAREPVLLRPGFSVRTSAITAAICFVLGVLFILLFWEELNAALYRFAILGEGVSVETRPYYYQGAWRMWLEEPIVGLGLGMFAIRFPEFRSKELSLYQPFKRHYLGHTHNEYLEILSETGLIGFLFYGFILFYVFRTLWKAVLYQRSRENLILVGFGCAILGLLIHNLFTVTLRQSPIVFLFWSFVGISVGYAWYQKAAPSPKRTIFCSVLYILLPVISIFIYSQGMRYYVGDVLMRRGHDYIADMDIQKSVSFNREQMEQAAVRLHASIPLAPDRIEPHLWLATGYYKFKDYHQARESYLSLEKLHPSFTSTPMNLSITLLKHADFMIDHQKLLTPEMLQSTVKECGKQSIHWIQRAIQDDPNQPEYYLILGRTYYMVLGETEKAQQAIQEALQTAKKRPFENPKDEQEALQLLKSIEQYKAMQEVHSATE